jgi:Arc/MetJ family transcription regulator
MAGHMKTTIHIPDNLLTEAQRIARRENTTLKALVQEGLLHVVAERRRKQQFRLKDASFAGSGLQEDMKGASWEQIRAKAYEGHGG